MKLKTKRKIRFVWFHFLSLITIAVILFIAFINERIIETAISMVLFFVFRRLFVKQYHAKSLYMCSFVSICVFAFVSLIELPLTISILFSVVITFMITYTSYYIKEYIDNKNIINELSKYKAKAIENLTLQEMYDLFSNIRKDKLEIVYGYLHRDKGITACEYADSVLISEPLLYKYVKEIKDKYKGLTEIC